MFRLVSKFKPTGDQPKAIKKLTKNIKSGVKNQVLLGVTGSGKTFTMAKVIENIQKPTLIIVMNKTLAAQLYQEFKEFFPNAGVHFFTSYYDYYQPEAYIPQTDTYIEKDARINEEIDKLRHAATQDLLTRKDVIVVASVSCIYSIGSPQDYEKVSLEIRAGQKIKRKELVSRLTSLQYQRNDIDQKPGTFRARGSIVDIFLVNGQGILRVEFLGDEIDKILLSREILNPAYHMLDAAYRIFPAYFWVAPQNKLEAALGSIKLELQEQIKKLKKQKKPLAARRLEQRTNYDLEMLAENGYCHGVENYSRHLEFRKPGQAPYALLDYYSADFLIFVDESHITLPQLRAMATQDRARKKTLIEYGFRLPSAIDNRPLTFEEFNKKISRIIYVSATPEQYEKEKAGKKYIVEQLIRPTGLLEPSIEIRLTKNQVEDLIREIRERRKKIQEDYNRMHKIVPLALKKEIRDWLFAKKAEVVSEFGPINDIKLLREEMQKSAKNLDFERAAELRDLIKKIKSAKD